MIKRFMTMSVLMTVAACTFGDTAVTLSSKGFVVRSGELGECVISYPALTGSGGGRQGPSSAAVTGTVADLTYADGSRIHVDLKPDGGVQMHAMQLPAGVKGLATSLTLPVAQGLKARWSIDGSAPQAFPVTAGTEAFLFKHDAKRLVLTDEKGVGFSVALPHGFHQLQDNRVWKTPTFQWLAFSELPRVGAGEAYFTLRISGAQDTAGAPAPIWVPAAKSSGGKATERLSLSLGDKNFKIAAGNMGNFDLSYPSLDAGTSLKPVEIRVAGEKAVLRYANGATLEASVKEGKIDLAFVDMPANVKSFDLAMFIPLNYNNGGSWKAGETEAAFPQQKPAKPHLYQGHARDFTLTSVDNKHLSLGLPENAYWQ